MSAATAPPPNKKTNQNATSQPYTSSPGKTEEVKEPNHEEIQKRAYEIYCANGCVDGHCEENWLQAEAELKQENQYRSNRQP